MTIKFNVYELPYLIQWKMMGLGEFQDKSKHQFMKKNQRTHVANFKKHDFQ